MKLPRLREWPFADVDVPVGKAFLTADQAHAIRHKLRFDNPEYFKTVNGGYDASDISRYIHAYEEFPQSFNLPRHAAFRKFGIREPRPVFPQTKTLPWEFTGTLRENQIDAFTALKKQLLYKKDGVLVLSCGKGKTCLAVAGFGWQQRPALAIVTQLFIGQQWKDALLQFTDIPEDRIGFIGDGKNEWDKDFVISTVQSLTKKDDLPAEFYRRFGVVFFDEVHRLGAPLFGRVVSVFSGVRIGLTATLERSDEMHKLFMLHVGKVFYEDRTQQLVPSVYFIPTPVQKDITGFRQWGRHGKLNMPKIVTHLSKLDYRQEFIHRLTQDALEKGRKVLLLTERRDELTIYQRLLGDSAGICVGGTTQESKDAALEKPVTLATSQLVKEGLDKSDIDTLIITIPQSSEAFSEQATGRILRVHANKLPPVIIVLVDSGVFVKKSGGDKYFPFVTKAEAMQQTFKKLRYKIIRGVHA